MIDRNFVLNLYQKSGDINEYVMSLYNMPAQIGAKNIWEIGSGVSTFALVAAANKTGGHVTSIDLGGWNTLDRVSNGEEIMKNESNFTMVTGDSLTVPQDRKNKIDFLFLDSGHTYQLTLDELNRWYPLVRKRGIIALHDTAHEAGEQLQCRQAFNEWYKLHEDEYTVVHLLDSKIIGFSVMIKI